MAAKKQTRAGNGSTAVLSRPATYEKAIRRVLSGVPQIDAVFLLRDETNVIHIYSVVREFQSKFYTRLLPKETAIEKKFPEMAFEFHVRAHQGREPAQAAPFEAELVYSR